MKMHKSAEVALSPQQRALTDGTSALSSYRELSSSGSNLVQFIYQEFVTTLFSGLAGVLGFGTRTFLYPFMFDKCGRRPAVGRNVLFRSPRLVQIGDKVLIDDYATLDVRSGGRINLGSFCSIGRFTSLVCKGESIRLEPGVNIGSYCRIATQSEIIIGASTLVAAYCYIGPGNHTVPDSNTPIIEQEMELGGGVRIGQGVWIGTRATILDGVSIGDGAVIGAHSLVRENVPAGAIVVGTPARIIGQRKDPSDSEPVAESGVR